MTYGGFKALLPAACKTAEEREIHVGAKSWSNNSIEV